MAHRLAAVPLAAALSFIPARAHGQGGESVSVPRDTAVRDTTVAADSTTGAAPGATRRVRMRRDGWSIGAWAGGAPTSYAGHFIGATPGRALALTGVRLGGRESHFGRVAVEYVATIIPAAFAYDNPVGQLTPACPDPGAPVVTTGRRRQVPMGYCHRRVFGAGVLPVGTQVTVPLAPQLRLFAAANAGGVLFAQNVPIPEARRLNFMFDFGGGLEFGPRRLGALTLGYKLNHISNAWTAPANPGLDHHVFYAGFVHGMRVGPRRRAAGGAGVTAATH